MELTEKHEELLVKCVDHFTDYLACDSESEFNQVEAAFAYGLTTAIGAAKYGLCISCPHRSKKTGCTVNECPLDEMYVEAALGTVEERLAARLEVARKKD